MPIESGDIVEGGGLRSFGIANALSEVNNFRVTIAVSKSYLHENVSLGQSLRANQYSDDLHELSELISISDTVIYPASAVNIARYVLGRQNNYTTFIADAYVPIHVEVSARQTGDLEVEELAFSSNSQFWTESILNADAIMCASQSQKNYYTGFLAGSGNLTPKSYTGHPIILTPFGINSLEISKKQIKSDKSAFKILWYGGFYPWFDTELFRQTVLELNAMLKVGSESKKLEVVVLGAVNPFVTEPSFLAHTNAQLESLNEMSFVSFVDWVPYAERGKLISQADLAISFNPEGPENDISWRTRYLDFITFGVPLFTNTLDPLSKLIIEYGVGYYTQSLNPKFLASELYKLVQVQDNSKTKENGFAALQEILLWKKCISELAEYIEDNSGKIITRKNLLVPEVSITVENSQTKISRLHLLFKIFLSVLRKEGFKAAIWRLNHFLRKSNVLNTEVGDTYSDIINIYVHQLDFSGSPLIALQMATDLSQSKSGAKESRRVVIHNFGNSNEKIMQQLRATGVIVYTYGSENEFPRPKLDESHILNGLALPHRILDLILFDSVNMKHPPRLVIHEDRPEMYLNSERGFAIGMAARRDRLMLISPSKGTAKNFNKFINAEVTKNRHYPTFKDPIPSSLDFSMKLRIQMLASSHDSRKNQKYAILLLTAVRNRVLKDNDPERWRDLELVLVGIDKKTPYGKEVYELVELVGDFVEIHAPLPFDEAKKISRTCNAVICVSEYETLPVFVAEGMGMGQIVFRNDCSGLEEQLIDGQNGVLIDEKSIEKTIEKITLLLDKGKTSDETLIMMSNKSKSLVEPYNGLSYEKYLQL